MLLGWGRGCGASACVHKGHGPAARAREKARRGSCLGSKSIVLDVLCKTGVTLVHIAVPPPRAGRAACA